MSQREEILDMAVHALTPLMSTKPNAQPHELFEEALDIANKLIARVDAIAPHVDGIDRDELLDMGVHGLSALLKGRSASGINELLDECMEGAQLLIRKVDATLGDGADENAREELLDLAVHAQTAFLASRPPMDADDISTQSVAVAQSLVARVDA